MFVPLRTWTFLPAASFLRAFTSTFVGVRAKFFIRRRQIRRGIITRDAIPPVWIWWSAMSFRNTTEQLITCRHNLKDGRPLKFKSGFILCIIKYFYHDKYTHVFLEKPLLKDDFSTKFNPVELWSFKFWLLQSMIITRNLSVCAVF